MKTIQLQVRDTMDIALLLTGINHMRKSHLNYYVQLIHPLPKEFNTSVIIKEIVDDYDRLNSLGAQLSSLIEKGDTK